jgi:hypothetical protein
MVRLAFFGLYSIQLIDRRHNALPHVEAINVALFISLSAPGGWTAARAHKAFASARLRAKRPNHRSGDAPSH